ncbi:hypothetical protein ACHAXR_010841 [Thalassiosira sp. AJA248-18]
MGPSTEPSSVHACSPFNDSSFLNLCETRQVDNLSSLLDVEKRYCLSGADCYGYRRELDTAAGAQAVGDTSSSSNNTDWRFRIARWMLRASDEFSLSRETALIALSYCDRFLLKKKISRHLFQVVAITCLLVSSKLFEKRPIKVATLVNYTQGKFTRNEVLKMEAELVASIGSHMYPPTAGAFVLMFLNEYFSSSTLTSTAIESCQFMIELATCDFYFVTHKQSKLAKAAIFVTLEQTHLKLSPELIQTNFTEDIETMACVNQLRKIYSYNEMRIKAIDDKSENITTKDRSGRKRICRAATPSPTPEDMPEQVTSISERGVEIKFACSQDSNNIDGGQCKRQRYRV